MLHPSYTDLMQIVNQEVEEGDAPVVSSRYSIVLATSKRARQIIDGCVPYVDCGKDAKPLSVAVAEINNAKVKIFGGSVQTAEEQNEEGEEQALETPIAEEVTAELPAEEDAGLDGETEEN